MELMVQSPYSEVINEPVAHHYVCHPDPSLRSEILCLVPVVLSLYIGLSHTISNGPAWNAVLLFGGMALSRIGLWSFDLVQLQILQETLANHSRRNAMTALQLSLQNAFDMTKYVLVLGLNRPEQFKWTALVSWIAVFTGVRASSRLLCCRDLLMPQR